MVMGAAVAIPRLFGDTATGVFVLAFVLGLLLAATALSSDIKPEHDEELRTITARMQAVADGDDGEPFRTEQERRRYGAHYRRLVEHEAAVKTAVAAETQAFDAVATEISTTARTAFPRSTSQPEWFPGDMISNARRRLRGSDDALLDD
jgi:hypothetical protein